MRKHYCLIETVDHEWSVHEVKGNGSLSTCVHLSKGDLNNTIVYLEQAAQFMGAELTYTIKLLQFNEHHQDKMFDAQVHVKDLRKHKGTL